MSVPKGKNRTSTTNTRTKCSRRPYSSPKIVSAELLEIAAAKCDVGGFGKEQILVPPTCLDGVGS